MEVYSESETFLGADSWLKQGCVVAVHSYIDIDHPATAPAQCLQFTQVLHVCNSLAFYFSFSWDDNYKKAAFLSLQNTFCPSRSGVGNLQPRGRHAVRLTN